MSRMRLARMDQFPEMCVMTRLIWSQCVQTWVRRNTVESSCKLKHIKVNPVPVGERRNLRFSAPISVGEDRSEVFRYSSMPDIGQTRRLGGEFLILGRCGEAAMGLGVIDDIGKEFLAERGQRALPELAGGFALFDEYPLLRRDG